MNWEQHFNVKPFEPLIIHRALATRVLCVAGTRLLGDWTAYCDAVPGINHYVESNDVIVYGEKMSEQVARALFPEFNDLHYNTY